MHEISNNVVCATSKGSDQPAHTRSLIRAFASRFEYSISVKLLTEHNLEVLSLAGSFTGSSESTLVKIPHCWKSRVTAHFLSAEKAVTSPINSCPFTYSKKCSSEAYRYTKCKVAGIISVELSEQISNTDCGENNRWGHTSSFIWVDDGCRANFQLCLSTKPGKS